MIKAHLTYANVIATVALFIALGGGAYAAINLPKGSVGPGQLQRDAVDSSKVKNHSLRRTDFGAGQIPAGPTGPSGPVGPVGPKGDPGATQVVTRSGPDEDVPNGGARVSYAACEPGEAVTGGGYDFTSAQPANTSYFIGSDGPSLMSQESLPGGGTKTTYSRPPEGTPATGWSIFMRNETGSPFSFQAFVMCASP